MASVTAKIRLATGICLVPEHNPLVLAKVVATLDSLSEGRFMLGVGVGWLEEEFRALGIPWERRAQRTREYIEAMRRLWGDALSSLQGRVREFRKRAQLSQARARRRLAGLLRRRERPGAAARRRVRQRMVRLQSRPGRGGGQNSPIESLLKSNGRKRSDVELAVSPYTKPITKDDLKRYRDAGVDEVVVVNMRAPRTPEEAAKGVEEAARKWIDAAAKL